MANFKAVVRGERKDGFMQVYIRVYCCPVKKDKIIYSLQI